MPVERKVELHERLKASRAKGPHYFARLYQKPEQLKRLAYHTTMIDWPSERHMSFEEWEKQWEDGTE